MRRMLLPVVSVLVVALIVLLVRQAQVPGTVAPEAGSAATVAEHPLGAASAPVTVAAPPDAGRSSSGGSAATPTRRRRNPDRYILDISIADFASRYEALAAAAHTGDATAARALYRGTYACYDAARDEEDLRGQIEELRRNDPDGKGLQDAIHFKKSRFSECAHLTLQQRDAWPQWLKLAAQLGGPEERLTYVRGAASGIQSRGGSYWRELGEYRELAERYLNEELARGNPEALRTARLAYAQNTRMNLYQPDLIKEYAYEYAYQLTRQGDEVHVDGLAIAQGRLSESQIRQAMALGMEIYKKCCDN